MKNPSSSPEDSPGPLPGAPTVDDILGSTTIRPLARQELDGATHETQGFEQVQAPSYRE